MKLHSIALPLVGFFGVVGFAPLANAALYQLKITTTASSGDTIVSGASLGDPISVLIVVDNGNSVVENQTWTAANVVSITFDVNNGGNRTVFGGTATGNGWNGTSGTFTTDAGGLVSGVPANWSDLGAAFVISTNAATTPFGWVLNGSNDKLFETGGYTAGFAQFNYELTPSNWTVTAVPEPSVALLGGLAAMGLLRRRR